MTSEVSSLPVDPDSTTSAFAYTNYRRFFIGQSLSNIGTWFQQLAQALLVLKITGRASSLGEVLSIQALPILVLGPFVGSFIDRVNLRRVMVVISTIAGVEAFALSILVATHHVTVLWIFGLSLVLGFSQIFLQPSIQTLVPELVATPAIPSAVSLNGVQQAVGRLAGPAIAGLIYAWKGPGTCFVINGISYFIVVAAVLSLRKHRLYPRPDIHRSTRQFIDGFIYVWRSPLHRTQLCSSFIIGCLAFNYPLFYSSFTQFVLHSGTASFGIAESINAAFAVIGGVTLSRRLRHPTRRNLVIACIALSVTLGNIAFAPNVGVFYFDMVPFGFVVVSYTVVNNSLFQLNTPRERLGSVMTLVTYTNQGTTPIGSIIMGWVIAFASARAGIGIAAIAVLISAGFLSVGLFRKTTNSRPTQPAPFQSLDEVGK